MANYYKGQERLGWIEAVVAGVFDTVEGVFQIVTTESGKSSAGRTAYEQEQQTLYEKEMLRRATEGLSAISQEQFNEQQKKAKATTMKVVGITALVLGAYWLSGAAYKRKPA